MLKLFVLAALAGVSSAGTAKVALTPVTPSAIAVDAMACLKHMSVTGLDSAGLKADGWKQYQPADLPGRHFIDSVTIYADGDGMAFGYDATQNAHPGCTLVALPTPSPDFGPIADQLSAKLAAHPVFEKPDTILWAPNGPDDVLIMLTKDPVRPDLVDVIMRASSPTNRTSAPLGQQG